MVFHQTYALCLHSGVTRREGEGGPALVTTSRGWQPNEINFCGYIYNIGQRTLESGEGGSGDETIAKNKTVNF